jgi:uncharacterized protein YgiM (DUF1202 family)
LWIFTAISLTAAGGMAIGLSQSQPSQPVTSVSGPPVADLRTAPDPAPPEQLLPAPELQPVLLLDLQPRPETSPVPQPRSAEPSGPAVREVVTTARSGANMRSAPSMSSTVVWTAPNGTRLRVAGEEGSWLQVATPNGERTGWMHDSVVTE